MFNIIKRKKLLAISLSFVLTWSFIINTTNINATEFEGKENDYISLCSSSKLTSNEQSTCKRFNTYLNNKNKKLQENIADVEKDSEETKNSIDDIQNKITELDSDILKAESELEYVKNSISNIQKNIDENSKILSDRMYEMQSTMNSNVLVEFLFGASDFVDFFQRSESLKEITAYENQLIETMKQELNEIEKQKESAELLTKSLESSKKEQKILQDSLQQKLQSQNQSISSNNSEISKNSESVEKINKNLESIKKASEESRVDDVTQANPKPKPTPKPPEKPSTPEEKPDTGDKPNSGEKPDGGNNSNDNTDTSTNEELGLKIANKALTRLGYMYVWGGAHSMTEIKNPNHTKFDCSGLVNWAHYQAGVNIGVQYTGSLVYMGKSVQKSDLQAGDIIMFSDNGNVSGIHHVGIYIGDNKMVHAPTTGSPVQVASLNSSYWQREWYNARRLY